MRRSGIVLAVVAAGCLEPTAPRTAEVAAVRVTLGTAGREVDTVQVRGTTPIDAVGLTAGGVSVGPVTFTYASSDTTVAVVTSLGTVQGIAPGAATITARAPNGREGAARVVVIPSTIAYEVRVGASPGAIAFSTDYARAYVLIAPDSLAVIDALRFTRIGAARVGLPGWRVAATTGAIYVTHPDADSVSVLAPSTNRVVARLFVGAGPRGAVASVDRAFIAASDNHTIAVLDGTAIVGRLAVGGEPHDLAITRDGRRLVATVGRDDGWYLMTIDATSLDTLGSVRLDGVPTGVAVSPDGRRAFALYEDQRIGAFVEAPGAPGRLASAGELRAGDGAGGIAAKQGGDPFVIVSGAPLVIFHGGAIDVVNEVADGGDGFVAVRPDGIFAFVSVPGAGVVRVVAAE
jgi:YVTN family beta-propeller protein